MNLRGRDRIRKRDQLKVKGDDTSRKDPVKSPDLLDGFKEAIMPRAGFDAREEPDGPSPAEVTNFGLSAGADCVFTAA